MARLVHKATDRLSAEAQRAMAAGFASKLTYAQIAANLRTLGEKVSERTIARRGAEWQADQERRQAGREQISNLLEAMREGNWESGEMVRALATQALMDAPGDFAGSDPVKVQRLNLRAQELKQKQQALDLRAREIALDERRVALLQEKERRMTEALTADKGEQLPAEERLKRAMEAWGLK